MSRPILFLLAIVTLSHGASGNAPADDSKRRLYYGKGGTQPSTPEAEYEKGNAAFDRKDWNEARSRYDAALRLNADHVPSLLNRGRVALVTGKVNDAAADFRKVVELKPELPAPRTYLAAALLDQGKHADAIVQAGKAVELDPKQAFAWYIRGTAQIHKGEFRKGIDDLSEAAKLVPNDPVVFNNRGIAWQKLGDEAKAKADFERRDQLNAKPNAKLKMEQALARHDQIDRHIKSLQNPGQVGRLAAQGVPVRQVVRPVPPELLRQRDEAWKAYLEACKVYNDLP
jgi:tetratricopeptide (TPR) repeat protein